MASSLSGPISTEILDRQPPFSLEAEAGVLGSIVLNPDVCDDVALVLRAEDFYDDANRRLYETMREMHDAGQKIDSTLLVERLKMNGDFEGAVWDADLDWDIVFLREQFDSVEEKRFEIWRSFEDDYRPEEKEKTPVESQREDSYRQKISRFINNVLESDDPKPSPPDAADLLVKSIDVMQGSIARLKLAAYAPDLTINIPRNAATFFEFHRAEEMAELGYKRTCEALDDRGL